MPYRRILIYCEGKNTEKIYLGGVRNELRQKPITIVVGPKHGEPLSLVTAAAKHAASSGEDEDERFDEVWCVIDVEAPKEHGSLGEAITEAYRKDVRIAVSNPCFELWLIMHFQDQRSYLTTKQAQKKLSKILPGYDPDDGKSFNFQDVCSRANAAARRAVTTHRGHEARDMRCENPCTSVTDLLVAIGFIASEFN